MTPQYKKRIRNFCQHLSCSLEWQPLRFGYERAVLTFKDSKSYTEAQTAVYRLKDTWHKCKAFFEGEFEGTIYLMYTPDHQELTAKLEAETAEVNAWWQRYHDADEETREKMRRGDLD